VERAPSSRYGGLVSELVGQAAAGQDLAWIRLAVDSSRIVSARGEGPGMADLCRTVRGLTCLAAGAVPGHALSLDALHEAIGPAVFAEPDPARSAVAMSGGVDSAVALLSCRDAGHDPVGVTLRLWVDPAGPDSDRACCSPASVVAARELCHGLGFPHFTLDLRREFRRAVVAPFISGYARGETPNPCIRCNGSFRFAELLSFAARIGAARLVTGHYARIGEHRGRRLLARGTDPEKDQSYMLGRLHPRHLARVSFPLGGQSKRETRAQARAAGLPVADRVESQEACFLGGADYRDFLARAGLAAGDGPIVDEQGRELGRHGGFWRFTPGQRRGLRIATGQPVYTLRTDARSNSVVVGPRESLGRRSIRVRTGALFVPVERVEAKLRYRSPATAASVKPFEGGFDLELDEAAHGVAPGQAAVLYEDGFVVGAGLIAGAE
jgi:tRNA-uridine 2-sulfurtransferase